jgi:ubiquinone/menaquinone biosynthesis C-methylase UbiE
MSRKTPAGFHDFQQVDRETRPEAHVSYLDAVTGIVAIQAYKQRSYDLLNLKPGDHVIDVGCGTGDDVRAMAQRVGMSGRVVGFDNSEVMIAEAKKRSESLGLPVQFQAGSVFELPYGDNRFHAARADRMFQHLSNPKAALREMVRVTRPTGTVGVLDPDWGTLVVDSPDRTMTTQIFSASQDDTPTNPWMGRQLYALLDDAGLRNLQILPLNIPILTFSSADLILNLQSYVNRAVEKHVITSKQGSQWISELLERDRRGRFFSSLSGFGIFGTKEM